MVEPPAGAARIVQGRYGAVPESSSAALVKRPADLFPDRPRAGLFDWDCVPVVLDTSMLLNDIVDAARGRGGSLLLASSEKDVAHLYATEEVRGEVERNLERRAAQGHVAPERAAEVWRRRYLPAIRFVAVDGVPRGVAVAALADRHINDLPTGLLAELLAPCLVFAADRDLLDCGIARRDWTSALHNAEEAKQLQLLFSGGSFLVYLGGVLGFEGIKSLVRFARAAPVPAIAVGGVVTLLLHSHLGSDRGRAQLRSAKQLLGEGFLRLGEIMEVAHSAEGVVRSAAFVLEVEPSDLAHAARTVAVATTPQRPGQVADAIGVSVQKATALLQNPVFMRTAEGHYLLGQSFAPIEGKKVEIIRFASDTTSES